MITQVFLGTRDLIVPTTHWRDIEDFQFPSEGNVVLIMPGGGVDKSRFANGCIKRFLDTMADLMPDNTEVISAYYDDSGVPSHRIKSLRMVGALNDVKTSFPVDELPPSPDYTDFFNRFFMPLLVDKDNKKYSADEICSKLNRLMLVGYCYGGFVSFEMARLLEKKLKQLKFSKSEQKRISKALKIIACSSRFAAGVFHSSVFHIVSYSDKQLEKNWHYKNFHSFLNTKKRNDESAFIVLRDNEVILTAKKLLSVEMDDHHYRAYFKDYSSDFDKTKEGEFVSKIITQYISLNFATKGEKSPKELISMLPENADISERLDAGKRFLLDYKKYVLTQKRNFSIQEGLVQNENVDEFRKLIRSGQNILPYKNKKGNFLIHMAIETGNLTMVDLITKNEPFWFQSFNSKGENPVLIALRQRNVDMAFLLYSKLNQTILPVFESYSVLKNIQRKTMKGILLFIRKIPEAVTLLDKILDDSSFLPIKDEDVEIISRHMRHLSKRRTKSSYAIQNVLKKYLKRAVDENGVDILNPVLCSKKQTLSKKFINELMREE